MPTGFGGGGVSGYPLTLFQYGANPDSAVAASANAVNYTAFGLWAPISFGHLVVNVGAGDGVNNSDIGIYNAAGSALLANIGAQHIAGTGIQTFTLVQGTVTLTPARYILAFTSVASTLTLQRDGHWGAWAVVTTGTGSSSGGALPASIPAPTLTINQTGHFIFALYT